LAQFLKKISSFLQKGWSACEMSAIARE